MCLSSTQGFSQAGSQKKHRRWNEMIHLPRLTTLLWMTLVYRQSQSVLPTIPEYLPIYVLPVQLIAYHFRVSQPFSPWLTFRTILTERYSKYYMLPYTLIMSFPCFQLTPCSRNLCSSANTVTDDGWFISEPDLCSDTASSFNPAHP